MADYYTKLSFVLVLAREASDWITRIAGALESLSAGDDLEEALAGLDAADRHVANALYSNHEQPTCCLFETTENELWVHSDESANPPVLADLLQEACKRFGLKGAIAFEWSNDCSKPRTDAYGGGAVVITAAGQRWLSTGRWLDEQLELMTQAGDPPAA